MGDTQKSQTTSGMNRESVEQTTHNSKQQRFDDDDKPPVLTGEVSLQKIVSMARENPEMVFTSVAHRIDLSLLNGENGKLPISGMPMRVSALQGTHLLEANIPIRTASPSDRDKTLCVIFQGICS